MKWIVETPDYEAGPFSLPDMLDFVQKNKLTADQGYVIEVSQERRDLGDGVVEIEKRNIARIIKEIE